jgi:hypothetical protein
MHTVDQLIEIVATVGAVQPKDEIRQFTQEAQTTRGRKEVARRPW